MVLKMINCSDCGANIDLQHKNVIHRNSSGEEICEDCFHDKDDSFEKEERISEFMTLKHARVGKLYI